MNVSWRTFALGVAAMLVAACSDPVPSASDEVVGELRALRLVLQQPARVAPSVPGAKVDATTALAPLREVLDALVANQKDQAARQLALTQEMQRWSQLLVEAVGQARVEEATAMTAKLRQLEQSLQSQDARHREVEGLMQGALERTADRLEDFLRRLQGGEAVVPNASPAGATPGNGGNAPGKALPANGAGNDERQAAVDLPVGRRAARSTSRWWWLLLSGLGVGVAFLFLRRARSGKQWSRPQPVDLPPPAPDQGAQEIWAAAALLGEAVGRLRQNTAGERGSAGSLADAVRTSDHGEPALNDLFVITDDDDDGNGEDGNDEDGNDDDGEVAPKSPPANLPPPVAKVGPTAPAAIVLRCGGVQAEARLAVALASEPRVLRRPAPQIHVVNGGLEVRLHLLPGLSAGERSRVLARLRDATR